MKKSHFSKRDVYKRQIIHKARKRNTNADAPSRIKINMAEVIKEDVGSEEEKGRIIYWHTLLATPRWALNRNQH